MYKKTVTYTDFFDKERTEDFYFHLTEAQIMDWVTTNGDYTLDQLIQRLIDSNNGNEIMKIIDDLISRSYGVVSLDGRRFDKSPEILADFKATNAYSKIFTEFVTDGKKAADFVSGIMPKDVEKNIMEMISKNPEAVPEQVKELFDPKAKQDSQR